MLTAPQLLAAKVLGILVAVLLIAGGSFYGGHHYEALAFDAYKAKQGEQAAKQVTTNHDAVAAISASDAAGLRVIAANAQESRNEIQKRNDALVGTNAALSDTVSRLRTRLAGSGIQSAALSQAATGGSDDHGSSGAALPDGLEQLVKFNSARFLEADDDAINLTAAQAVLTQDRLICNGALPSITQ